MPDKASSQANSPAKKPTAAPIQSTRLVGSRWQVMAAGAMLAVWIAFLVAMALYSS